MTLNAHNTIYVKAIFNDTDTLDLNFDSGTTELVLTGETLKNKLNSVPDLYRTLYRLQIGDHIYETKVYDAVLSGHGTDGRFGWDLFKGKIVELNYDQNLMIVHATLPSYVAGDKKFTKLDLEFIEGLLFVAGVLKQNGVTNKQHFLFDTGYQRTAMLDNDLLQQDGFPFEQMPVIKTVIMKGAQGNEIPVVTAGLETLKIGKYKLKNIPVQRTVANKPLRGMDTHILGNEVLKRFNIMLDFQRNVVYLKPNHLFHATYTEQKKKDS